MTLSINLGLFEERILRQSLPLARYSLIGISLMGIIASLVVAKYKLVYHKILIPIFAFSIWGLLSISWSFNPSLSLLYAHYICLVSLSFFIIYNYQQHHNVLEDELVMKLFSIFLLIFCAGIIIYNHSIIWELISTNIRIQPTVKKMETPIGGKNVTAILLAQILPLLLVFKSASKKNINIINLSILGCVFMILFFGSRNAYLALLITAIMLLIIYFRSEKLYSFVVASIILVMGFVILVGPDKIVRQLKHKTMDIRVRTWSESLTLVPNHWLNGIGVGQWNIKKYETKVTRRISHPHNDFVRFLVELGVIGILLYYGFLFWIFFLAYLNYKKKKDIIDWFLMCSSLVHMSLSIWDQSFFMINQQLIQIIAWSLILFRAQKNGLSIGRIHTYIMKGFTGGILLFVLIVFLYQNFNLHLLNSSLRLQRNGYNSEALSKLQNVELWAGDKYKNKSVHALMAGNAKALDKEEMKIYYLEEAVTDYPYDDKILLQLVRYHFDLNELDVAFEYLEKSFKKNPCLDTKQKWIARYKDIEEYKIKATGLEEERRGCVMIKNKIITNHKK